MTNDWLPDVAEITEWATEGALLRGGNYFKENRVEITGMGASRLTGKAHGNETYGLWLQRDDDEWSWHCDCPAAVEGAFCKHLVAAVMTALDEDAEVRKGKERGKAVKSKQTDELLAFLHAQPVDRLAGWLRELASEDRDIEKRLLLHRAAEQPDTLKAALGKLLATGGFLDYHRAIGYAQRLDQVIEQLEHVLPCDPATCRELCEYVLKRVIKVYAGRSDDSAGAIGECLHAIADLHAQACAAATPGKALAKTLFDLECIDGWGFFPLERYWDALAAAGQAEYGKKVLAEFERLPPTAARSERYGESFGVCRRAEELARCAGDFELLQRVLRRDLSHAWDHLRVLESLREFGRGREALAWAEAAVKKFPGDTRLRSTLAECLAEAGMDGDALEQTWQCFCEYPDEDHWDALKARSGKVWAEWRERALRSVAEKERGGISRRIDLLLHDRDIAGAVSLAEHGKVELHTLVGLAACVKRVVPEAAGGFYLRAAGTLADHLRSASEYKSLVAWLREASRLAPASAWKAEVTRVRVQHARKPKLMGMLDKAGL